LLANWLKNQDHSDKIIAKALSGSKTLYGTKR
jgi:hypothetical protein